MRLLVTGGAGFIGSNFVRRLLTGSTSSVTKIIVLDKLTYAGTFENLEDFKVFVFKDAYNNQYTKKPIAITNDIMKL